MRQIGPYQLRNCLFLAPMVGVSDAPFREICSAEGAGLTVGEMLSSNSALWQNERNRHKIAVASTVGPRVVQIAGAEPRMMAEAARLSEADGADAIDINMGCPAKTVLKKAAGSALLRDEQLVARILHAVVGAVDIPVTLKIRTGWCPASRNGVEIARLAQDCGIRLVTVHGRTRADRFRGSAEYDTIAQIKQAVSIPVIANGDIDSGRKAAEVLRQTGADGVMVGRAALGRPWIFREIGNYLSTGHTLPDPDLGHRLAVCRRHLDKIHRFYGPVKGVWFSRKHVSAYVKHLPSAKDFLKRFNASDSGNQQLELLEEYFLSLIQQDNGAIAA